MAVMLIFGRDMPKPGPILSDQCRIFANLFMVTVVVEEGVRKEAAVVVCPSPARLCSTFLTTYVLL